MNDKTKAKDPVEVNKAAQAKADEKAAKKVEADAKKDAKKKEAAEKKVQREKEKKAKADERKAAADEKKKKVADEKADKATEKKAKAEAAAEEKKKKAAEKKANQMPERNTVRRPRPESLCGQAWAFADKLSAELKQPVPIKQLLEATDAAGLNTGNVRAEYARWRKFNGVTGRISLPKPEVEAKPETKADTKAS